MVRFYVQPNGHILLLDGGQVIATLTTSGFTLGVAIGLQRLSEELVMVRRATLEATIDLLTDAAHAAPQLADRCTGTAAALHEFTR